MSEPLTRQPLLHRFRLLTLLRASLAVGAAYDLVFAFLMVVAPGVPAEWLSLPLPGATFYLWIMATFLVMLAAFYLIAAHDPRRHSAVIVIAIGGRALGAVVFTVAALVDPTLGGLYPLAVADLLFASVHAAAWLPIR